MVAKIYVGYAIAMATTANAAFVKWTDMARPGEEIEKRAVLEFTQFSNFTASKTVEPDYGLLSYSTPMATGLDVEAVSVDHLMRNESESTVGKLDIGTSEEYVQALKAFVDFYYPGYSELPGPNTMFGNGHVNSTDVSHSNSSSGLNIVEQEKIIADPLKNTTKEIEEFEEAILGDFDRMIISHYFNATNRTPLYDEEFTYPQFVEILNDLEPFTLPKLVENLGADVHDDMDFRKGNYTAGPETDTIKHRQALGDLKTDTIKHREAFAEAETDTIKHRQALTIPPYKFTNSSAPDAGSSGIDEVDHLKKRTPSAGSVELDGYTHRRHKFYAGKLSPRHEEKSEKTEKEAKTSHVDVVGKYMPN